MGKEERLRYPDIAKCVGIVAVLCAHAGMGMGLIWIQPYYMPMFFAVSGCVFEFLGKSVNDCIKLSKKMVRVYFNYSVIVAIIYIPLFFIKHNDYKFIIRNIIGIFYARKAFWSPLELENNIIFMEFGNGPMWFLACLAVAWILFIPLNYYKTRSLAVVTIIVLYLICGSLLNRINIMFPWSIDTAFIAAIFIFLGIWYEQIREKYLLDFNTGGYKVKQAAVAYGLCLTVYFIIIKRVSVGWNMSVGVYDTSISSGVVFFCILCMLGTAMLLLLCCLIEKLPITNILLLVGKKSLPILCFHSVIYQYIEVINSKLNLSRFSWYVMLKILVAMVACILLDQFMNVMRNKLRKR